MHSILADFHIHTLLSPCAEIEMTPHHIVMRAAEFGIGAVAITDHNASANALAAVKAGERYGVKVFPGMEVECLEEAHIVVLFDTLKQLNAWQQLVDGKMNGLLNNAEKFGGQFVVDDDDNFIREEKRLLLAPLRMTAAEVVREAERLGGMSIAAHIDRPSYSIVGQLGFIEPDFGFAAAEISAAGWRASKQSKLQRVAGYLPFVTDSDAHNIMDFVQGPKNLITVEELTIAELKLALTNSSGRSWKAGCYVDFEDK
jgi:PHP family Zn ribbon phosphoesterase